MPASCAKPRTATGLNPGANTSTPERWTRRIEQMEVEVAEPAEPRKGVAGESSIPGAPLASILLTEEWGRRPSRPPEFEKENRALAALVSALAGSARTRRDCDGQAFADIGR